MLRVGTGWDIHKLVEKRDLIIGGVVLESEKGCLGHSDGDALCHAIIDAMLGAAGLEDIGTQFPDNDPQYKDISSRVLLRITNDKIREQGWHIVNVDTTVILQSPKMKPYVTEIKQALAEALDLEEDCIGVKAKTAEQMLGELGTADAVVAQAVVLIEK